MKSFLSLYSSNIPKITGIQALKAKPHAHSLIIFDFFNITSCLKLIRKLTVQVNLFIMTTSCHNTLETLNATTNGPQNPHCNNMKVVTQKY